MHLLYKKFELNELFDRKIVPYQKAIFLSLIKNDYKIGSEKS